MYKAYGCGTCPLCYCTGKHDHAVKEDHGQNNVYANLVTHLVHSKLSDHDQLVRTSPRFSQKFRRFGDYTATFISVVNCLCRKSAFYTYVYIASASLCL